MKNRYFLEIAFNGSNYHGWQRQPGQVTIQSVMAEHISTLLREELKVHGCGRTDAGVHARKFYLHFDTNQELNLDFRYKLDSFLPKDITAKKLYTLSKRIHARYDAIKRSYEYIISCGKDPFHVGMAVTYFEKFDIDLMNEACKVLLKYNDFESFSKTNNSHNHYLCNLFEAHWKNQENLLIFSITANRFLRSMVRLIVGTMLDVSRKKINIEKFRKIIEDKDRTKAGKAVYANGLYLVDVQYPERVLVEMQ